ncbi:MAG: hypothetical protein AAGG01_00340 [Planctomycetota bacterium]
MGKVAGSLPTLTLHAGGAGALGDEAFRWRRFGKGRLRVERGNAVERPRIQMEGEGALVVDWKSGPVSYLRAPASFPIVPPALEGAAPVAKRKGQRWTHPKEYFSCTLPPGWSVEELEREIMVLNPGFTVRDRLDAIPLMGWGELEGADLRRTPTQLIQDHEAEWLRELKGGGMSMRRAKTSPRRVLVAGVPGAEQEWTGTANGRSLRMWLGAIVKGEAFLYTAVVAVDERADEFVPLAKQLFLSVVPTPPERNPALERALVGRSLASTSFIGDRRDIPDSTGWSYGFQEGGSVESFWYMSGGLGYDTIASASSTEWGSYEIYGKELFIYLESGQKVGDLVVEDGVPIAVDLGGVRYSL